MAIVRQARNDPDDALRGVVLRLLAVRDVRHRHAHHRPSLAVAAGSYFHAVYLCDFHWCCGRHRRNDHLYLTAISEALHGTPRLIVEIIIRLVVLGVAFCLIWFGYLNYLRGFGSFRLPSGTPIASLYAAIPLSGVLIGLFAIEQLVNGVTKGFDHPERPEEDLPIPPVDTTVQPRVGL